jgi:hypothetical protein
MTTTTNNKSLLKELNRILKIYYPEGDQRTQLIVEIISKFSKRESLRYELKDQNYLILSKDKRNKSPKQKYPNSPFPLLPNTEIFGKTLGE